MAYPTTFLRHTILFTLPNGEEANMGASWELPGGVLTIDDQDAEDFDNAFNSAWDTVKAYYPDEVAHVGSRLALVKTDGTTADTRVRSRVADSGTSTNTPLPNQIAVVASLGSGQSGRRSRGRMYWPAPDTTNMTATGRYTAALTAAVVSATGAYLSATPIPNARPVVASFVGAGLFTEITIAKVGDVPDTQRRRRDDLVEVYTSTVVA